MKGQLIPFVFMVLLVATVMIGYIFYNTFYGTKYQFQIYHTRVIDAVRNLIEDFKDYLKLSLTYSSHQALREHACSSGLIGAVEWICNQPNPVEVEDSRSCLEAYTKYYLNVYTAFFNTSLPVKISKMNSTKIVYDVNRDDVFSGKYDEGLFWVNSSGAKIAISGTNINEFENVDMNDFITKDRYWYMFRNFYEWANADVYSPCICSKVGCACGSSSGQEVCGSECNAAAKECAEKALNDLQRRFDENVKCYMKKSCCAQGVGPSCGSPCGCQGWENTICVSPCEHECKQPPPPGEICPVGSLGSSSFSASEVENNPYSNEISNKISFSADDICYCHYEARLAARYHYWCVDQKYNVPSDKGPVPLTFKADAIAFWRDPCRCCGICECPGCGC